jgi:HNH endonuclease
VMQRSALERMVGQILCDGTLFLEGLHKQATAQALMAAVLQWVQCLGRDLEEVLAAIEPGIRQSMLMSLIPAKALESTFSGSYDAAIAEHLDALSIALTSDERVVIRSMIINLRALQGLSSDAARARSASLGSVRSQPDLERRLRNRQRGRCLWCGVLLADQHIKMNLDHITPKHLGDDPDDGTNWALVCTACNEGKSSALTWSTTPYAYDYPERNDFHEPDCISLHHRWVVLRRSPTCAGCRATAQNAELMVYKRVPTGLPIPANCSTICTVCAVAKAIAPLAVRWPEKERARRSS